MHLLEEGTGLRQLGMDASLLWREGSGLFIHFCNVIRILLYTVEKLYHAAKIMFLKGAAICRQGFKKKNGAADRVRISEI